MYLLYRILNYVGVRDWLELEAGLALQKQNIYLVYNDLWTGEREYYLWNNIPIGTIGVRCHWNILIPYVT